jgi:hypothetical protein
MRAMWAEGAATNGVLVRTRASATWVTTTTTPPDGCCRRWIGRWSSVWTWRGSGLEAGWSRGLGGGRHAAGEGLRCFAAAMGRLDGHHRWRARSSSATILGGCECRVEMHRRLQSLPWVGTGHPPLARSPTSVLVLDPRSSAASWRPRNRDEIDELTKIDLHSGSRPQCPSYHPSPGDPPGSLFLHTPISLPSHPAPDRLMEPAHAVYS